MKLAPLNKFKDVICPHCHANIITPTDRKLKDGMGQCGVCGGEFRVVIKEENESKACKQIKN